MKEYCPNCFSTKYNSKRCNICGYQEGIVNRKALKPEIVLNQRYLLGKVLGQGGFGITYLAYDVINKSKCAIKEYFPNEYAVRSDYTLYVSPSSVSVDNHYHHGLQVFVNEAEVLLKLASVPQIVNVQDFFLANGTGYMVMEYLDGYTLSDILLSGPLDVDIATEMLIKLATALVCVHQLGLVHRDISPDNIIVMPDQSVRLIDFGATRSFLESRSKDMSVMLKPGFAPLEQYSRQHYQGTWTDVYALAATFYYIVTGQKLPDAVDRQNGVPIRMLHDICPSVGQIRSYAIYDALQLNFRERIQTMQELLEHFALQPDENQRFKKPYITHVRENGYREQWEIPKGEELMLGRDRSICQITLEEPQISRHHCSISYSTESGLFMVKDYSANGTYIDNQLIGNGKRVYLKKNKYINLGSDKLKFYLEVR